MANRNYASGGKLYSMHVKPVLLDCNFVVAATDSGGLGITSLKGPMIANVFMHTSATPGVGNNSITNPNPADGVIVVQLQDNFNRYLSGAHAVISPASGSDVKIDNSAMTAGVAYTITTLGNATAAKWLAIGVPAGVTPAVGVSFIAASTGGAGNALTSRVQTSVTSGLMTIEQIGNAQAGALAPNPTINQGFGGQLIFQCYDKTGALAAPVDGSIISLQLLLSDSSILIAGE